MVVKCEMSDKAKLWLLIFAIIAIGGLAFWGVYRLAIWLKWWSLLWMVGYGFLLSESVDAAIIKAFLVFIAYTNMRVKGKDTEIEAKELLQRICGLFVHDR